jgi:integrase
MSIEQRHTTKGETRYLARIKHRGHLVASKTFARKVDAVAWEREQYRRIAFGDFIPPVRALTPFAVVSGQFLESRRDQISPHSWRTDRDNLISVPAWFSTRPLSSIGASEILTYLTEQLTTKAHSTVRRAKGTLAAVFAYAIRERMLTRNPMSEVRMPSGTARPSEGIETFTAQEFARTLELQHQLHPGLAAVTEFLSLTGLRWSELRALRVGDVQHERLPLIRVSRAHSEGYEEKGTKTGHIRLVPLTHRAGEIAAARAIGLNSEDYLFTSATGRQLRSGPFRCAVAWSTTTPRGRTIHDLRHYAASAWLRAGIPINQVAKWLGHASPSYTLETYAHVLGEAQTLLLSGD